MELVRENQTEEEQHQRAAAEVATEPEEGQEEVVQMRDTDKVSAAEAIQHKPPGHEMWSRAQRKKWRDKEAKKQRKKTKGGRG